MDEKGQALEIRKKVVIDCDPGLDDAFALLLCLKHLDVLAVTTVGGNTGIDEKECLLYFRTHGIFPNSGLCRL